MIKATDLRIGNLLEYFVEDKIEGNSWLLNVVDHEDITIAVRDEYFNKYYRPIPLTEEWLLNCKQYDSKYKSLGEDDKDDPFVCLRYCENGILKLVSENDVISSHGSPMPHIKHLHQLQNLYFALTGIELEIKL